MKRYKPFTHPIDKKKERSEYRWNKMNNLAEINWKTVDLKEKYWRMDASYSGYSTVLEETMDDYEALSEESCMYCNRHCKQYRTHEDSWAIHLCLPCLIGDKITILLEKIIRRRRKPKSIVERLIIVLISELLLLCVWWYIEIYFVTVS